jgi:hypothetical protein
MLSSPTERSFSTPFEEGLAASGHSRERRRENGDEADDPHGSLASSNGVQYGVDAVA